MDHGDRLRRLALRDPRAVDGDGGSRGAESRWLDSKTLALVRLAALVAVGGAVSSYGALTGAAVDAGATATEIVDVLVGVLPVIGLDRVVEEAPKLALATEQRAPQVRQRLVD